MRRTPKIGDAVVYIRRLAASWAQYPAQVRRAYEIGAGLQPHLSLVVWVDGEHAETDYLDHRDFVGPGDRSEAFWCWPEEAAPTQFYPDVGDGSARLSDDVLRTLEKAQGSSVAARFSGQELDYLADEVMAHIWQDFQRFYEASSRGPGIKMSMADRQAFAEIAQPELRRLARSAAGLAD